MIKESLLTDTTFDISHLTFFIEDLLFLTDEIRRVDVLRKQRARMVLKYKCQMSNDKCQMLCFSNSSQLARLKPE